LMGFIKRIKRAKLKKCNDIMTPKTRKTFLFRNNYE